MRSRIFDHDPREHMALWLLGFFIIAVVIFAIFSLRASSERQRRCQELGGVYYFTKPDGLCLKKKFTIELD